MTSASPLLAAVMIVKNEEQHLGRCLSSIRDACDEIIIVDTGSTDSTVSIAESFGARVFHRIWNDDFAAARNESLEHTNAQWVLYIDADEMLINVDISQLRTMLTRSAEVAAFGLQVSPMIGWLPYTDFRLWRHDPSIRFTGDIHETTMPDIRRLAAERNQILQPIPLHIQHFGYEGDQTKKHLRNLPLLERQRQQTPRKINILNQLARIHFELGNLDEAEKIWQDALVVIGEDGEKEVIDVTIFAPYADLLMAKGIDAEPLIQEGKKLRADYLILHLAAAKNHFKMERYEQAIEEAQILLNYADHPPFDSRFAYNMQMFRLWPQNIVAESLLRLGRYSEARLALGNAVSMGLPYEQARTMIRHCEDFIESFVNESQSPVLRAPEKIDLSDATFLIPLRIESGDRLRNVIAVCEWLTRTFDTTVLVGHAEPEQIRPLLPASVEVTLIDDNARYPFHSTRIFNTLARHVTTPVLIQYDADVVFPPENLVQAVEHVRLAHDAVVYPYTYWHSIPGEEISDFMAQSINSCVRFGYPRSSGDPVGGCVVRNAQSFFTSGGDNEYFIGWNSEDKERYERLMRLGYNISRIDGPLFHLEHAIVRRTAENQRYHALGEAERERLRGLTDNALAQEVASWPWIQTTAHDNQPIQADDLTITIPVEIDSSARLQNLVVCTNTLLASTTAKIIVGTSRPDDVVPHLDSRITVVRLQGREDGFFHHTKMLNDLARLAETDFIANLDCDIVVPPQQWQETLTALRTRGADMVYPYGGEMLLVPHAYTPWFEQNRFASLPKVARSLMHNESVGGCVVWRRQSFFDCGMENENFISWGFEDDERYTRAQILGLQVERMAGSVFHLQHPRGSNSANSHPFFDINHQELERISEMNAEQLRNEIKSWSWCSHRQTH